jgi:hypothetical protein
MMTRRRILGGGIAVLAADLRPATAQDGRGRQRETMKITRGNAQPSRKGPAEYFTGSVRIHSLFQGTDPARIGGAFVTFEPGARTAWHTHPLGQTLIVTAGCGWVQSEDGRKRKSVPATWSGSPPARSTDMAPPQRLG